jgi:hypothetical protein
MKTDRDHSVLIHKIQQLPDVLEQLVLPLSGEQLTTPYLEGEFSVAQVVHHLADSHMNSFIRCKLMLTEQNPTLKPYDQDAWASAADASGGDISTSLKLLRGLHARWVVFWESLPAETWRRTGFHPEIGQVTLERQLEIYAAHGLAHLDQIRRTLAAGGIAHAR